MEILVIFVDIYKMAILFMRETMRIAIIIYSFIRLY